MRHVIGYALVTLMLVAGTVSAFAQAQREPPNPPKAAAAAPLNLNTATEADLAKLPGIGPATATRILEYRQKNGPFKKIEELMNVRGIGEKAFLKLKPLVAVVPPKAFA